jgi:hypothetical protein
MGSKSGQPFRLGVPEMQATVDAYLRAGSVTGAAKILGLDRRATQKRLDAANKAGLTKPRGLGNVSRWRPGAEIVAARKAEFERVRASGPNLANSVVHLPDDGPFMLIAFGDLHLDSPGADLSLVEYWSGFLDRKERRTALLMGDLLDNWVKPLQFLYATSEVPAPEGWLLLGHYLDEMGDAIDMSVAGNHDDWSGHSDLLGRLMEERGVLHRSKSLRAIYRTKGGRELTLNLRHSWPGRSQWNEVHAIKKAARLGVRDTILLGGHTHVSGESVEKDPMTGRLTWCVQVASFKTVDDYADTLGLPDRATAPAVALVIDPRRADTDPSLVQVFHDPAAASLYLQALRGAS